LLAATGLALRPLGGQHLIHLSSAGSPLFIHGFLLIVFFVLTNG
jgi:hypothetical protein